MTFPKLRKNEDLINRSNFCLPEFICILFGQGKMRVFKNCILGPEESSFYSTHFQESGKIYFQNFGALLVQFFFCARNLLKKTGASRPGQGPAGPQATAPSRRAPGARQAPAPPPLASPLVRFGLRVSPSPFLVSFSLVLLRLFFPILSLFLVPYPKSPLPSPI